MRATARVLIVMLVFAALPATAQAHATLLTSTPEARSVVAQPPAQVVLTFDQAVQPVAGRHRRRRRRRRFGHAWRGAHAAANAA